MPRDHDAFLKVGRGGAGNYHPSKQADEASKDLEAQQPNVAAAIPVLLTSTSNGPARAGRGGAGNFVDSTQYARKQEQLAEETITAATSNLKKHPHRVGWSGRGGAGNFNNDGTAELARRQEETERSKVAELERQIEEVVEKGLKMPEKAHHSPSKHDEQRR